LIAAALDHDLIAAGEFASLAARIAVKQLAARDFYDVMATVCRDNEAVYRFFLVIAFRQIVSLSG
jgi:hypothetical protein